MSDELARMRRLFNRLDAAVTHHKKNMLLFCDPYGPLNEDTALWKARDKILKDYAEGKG